MNSKQKKYETHEIANSINTGELLTHYYKNHRTRKNALARHLGRNPATIQEYEKNTTIQTAILWEISMVLKHNFFLDIACKLPSDFSTYAPNNDANELKIADLEAQIKTLTTERDILLKVLGKG
jgi:plasmid maintenance system antidote protein VapI